MKNGFYVVEMFSEVAILEIGKRYKDQAFFDIEFESVDSELKSFFELYAIDFDFWKELLNTVHVSYLGEL